MKKSDKGMELKTGIEPKAREDLARQLGKILDHTYSLMVRTHLHHWNVRGPLFEPLHELLEQHYKALFEATDVIAERIRQLGYRTPANGQQTFPSGVTQSHQVVDAKAMVEDLLSQHEAACRSLRDTGSAADDAGDLVTTDMLTEHLAFHEKAAWMFRSMLDGWTTWQSQESTPEDSKKRVA